jgi:hypothetical protein
MCFNDFQKTQRQKRLNKKSLLLIAIFSLFIISCEKAEIGECKTYNLLQGRHYSEGYDFEKGDITFLQNCSNRIEFTFEINPSMFYDSLEFQNGHNKVRGFSCLSGLNITQYSARITWRCRSISEMDIGFLVHLPSLNGKPELGFLLKDVKEGDMIFCVIEDRNEKGFYFYAENYSTGEFAETIINKRGAGNVKNHKLLEAPYFGGHETAPHNISIEICSLKL